MIRSALIYMVTAVAGYFAAVWILGSGGATGHANGTSTAKPAAMTASTAPRLSTARLAVPGDSQDHTKGRENIAIDSQCKGDLKKLPDDLVARLPFGGRAELDKFAADHPAFLASVRTFVRESLREDTYAAKTCFRVASPGGAVPVVLEFRLRATEAGFTLSDGAVLKAPGVAKAVATAQSCLRDIIGKTYSAAMPDLGGEKPAPYDGPLPWSISFTL